MNNTENALLNLVDAYKRYKSTRATQSFFLPHDWVRNLSDSEQSRVKDLVRELNEERLAKCKDKVLDAAVDFVLFYQEEGLTLGD